MEFREEYLKKIKDADTFELIQILNAFSEKIDCIDACLIKGDLFLSMDSLSVALSTFKKAATIDTSNVYAYYKIGLIYQLRNQDDSAVFFLQQALNKKTYSNAVINYYPIGGGFDDDKSKYDIDYRLMFFRLGVSFYYLNNLGKALMNFNTCIENSYMLKESLLYRGSIYVELNKIDDACKDFHDAQKMKNNRAEQFIEKYCK